MASGYLRVDRHRCDAEGLNEYTLSLTNFEVKKMFENLTSWWFDESDGAYNDFIKALLKDDRKAAIGQKRAGTLLPWFCVGSYSGFERRCLFIKLILFSNHHMV